MDVRHSRVTLTNTANLHAGTGQGTESGLSTRAGGLGAVTTSGTELDVKGGDTDFLALGSDILGSQHGSVGRSLVTIGLDLHTSGDTRDGFATGEIGNVDEGIVEGGEDVSNAKNLLVTTDLGAEGDVFLDLGSGLGLLGLYLVEDEMLVSQVQLETEKRKRGVGLHGG
jgi:hypothetical protein